MTLAEETASGDDAIRAVLVRLGDPRTIAATALGEEPRVAQASQGRTLVMLAMTGFLTVFTPLLGGTALIGAMWWLWTAPQWRNRDKVIATVAALVPLLFGVAQWVVPAGTLNFGLGDVFFPVGLAVLALPAAAAVHLLRFARRPS
ncbi:hypothetical protein PV726_39315 [Streptomyces europaeiscabiei]|nr:hypothetical protein [Streptomyces europaeiscabiei]MDX3696262.1 hypothetical protein [Streptomyces europaeiscabiei]